MRAYQAWLVAGLLLLLTGCGTTTAPVPATPTTATPTPAATARTGTVFVINSSGSTASYRAREKFADRELPSEAVGTTTNITGQIHLPPAKGDAAIRVDLRTLASDSSRRDSRLKVAGLETNTYPYADFVIEQADGLDKLPAAGQTVAVKLIGHMTIHGTTLPFTFTGEATMEGKDLRLKVGNDFDMTTFKVTPPSILGMLTVEPGIKLRVDVLATASN